MWCPKCAKYTVCAAIPGSGDIHQPGQRKRSKSGDGDIHYFERNRKCTVCGEEFETVEMHIDHLYELFRLREAMHQFKKQAEALIKWEK